MGRANGHPTVSETVMAHRSRFTPRSPDSEHNSNTPFPVWASSPAPCNEETCQAIVAEAEPFGPRVNVPRAARPEREKQFLQNSSLAGGMGANLSTQLCPVSDALRMPAGGAGGPTKVLPEVGPTSLPSMFLGATMLVHDSDVDARS